MFGRRRIGKTYLIRASFDYKFTFEHTGISNASIEKRKQKLSQLEKFRESLKASGYKCDKKLSDWNQAFNCLKEVIVR